MKTITIEQFETLLENSVWEHAQYHEETAVNDKIANIDYITDDEGELIDMVETIILNHSGFSVKESETDGIKVKYCAEWNFDECDRDSFESGPSFEGTWEVETSLQVVDEDGDLLTKQDLNSLVCDWSQQNGTFDAIDFSEITCEIEQIDDVDVDEDSDMETFTLEIDNAPSIRFTGERIARSCSSDNNAAGSYSGQTGRWTELELYKTVGGKYVCHQVGCTRWQGERDRFSGEVCETTEEVKNFFGYRWLAKDLYFQAGIDAAVDVE